MIPASVLVARRSDAEEAEALLRCLSPERFAKFVISDYYVPRRATYLSRYKLGRVRELVEEIGAERLYIYDDLRPSQVTNLMRELRINVVDKIGLILEIFALHAGSKEAKLQIEMAEIRHRIPLIKEWIHRSKLGELPGFLGGGAYAIDKYYRHLTSRLARLRRELERLRKRRAGERQRRWRLGFPHIAIAGYTNAGKTTLFNRLTGERKPVSSEMFTTISPKSSSVVLNGRKVIFVDTVGFIMKIPAEVIEAFHATLDEITYSDISLLVVDSSEKAERVENKLVESLNILKRIGFIGKPLIVAVNKVDLTDDMGYGSAQLARDVLSSTTLWEWSVVRVSARTGYGIGDLLDEISRRLPEKGIRAKTGA